MCLVYKKGGIHLQSSWNQIKEVRYYIVLCIVTVFVGFFIVWEFGKGELVSAKSDFKEVSKEKYYTSVQIQEGDTIRSIAKKYWTRESEDFDSYVREIKACNGLYNDSIVEGGYLLIPYYSDTPLEATFDDSGIKQY